MVYATRKNKTMVTTKPLKTKHKITQHERDLNQFLDTHAVHFTRDASGRPVFVTEQENHD